MGKNWFSTNILKYLSFLWIAVFIFLWQYFSSTMYDDIPYLRIVTGTQDFWDCKGEYIQTFNDVVTSSINHHKYINGRLTDILMILSVLFPKWLASLIIGLFTAAMVFLIFTFTNKTGRRQFPAYIYWAVALILWLWFPWHNNFVSMAYKLNYIVPSIFCILYATGFIFTKSRNSISGTAILCVVSFVTGLLHEGFSLPLIGASIIIIAFYKDKRHSTAYLMTLFLILGAIICIFSPSTIMRFLSTKAESGPFCNFNTFISGLKNILLPIIISLAIFSVYLAKAKGNLLRNKTLMICIIFWLSNFIIALGIAFVLNGSGRFYWYPALCLLICDLLLLQECNFFKKEIKTLSIIFMGICISWSICFLHQVIKVADNQNALINTLRKGNDGIAYIDLIEMQDIPWWTLRMIHQYGITPLLWNGFFESEDGRFPLILPKDFQNKTFEEWPKIVGDNPFRGYTNHFYSKNEVPKGSKFKMTSGDKTLHGIPFKPVPESTILEINRSYFSLDSKGDTLWIADFDFPNSFEIERVDFCEPNP